MTLTLILTRHAKSDWSNQALDDHERPLNARGRASAEAVGGWLAKKGEIPGQVLCSDAVRTRETYQLMRGQLPDAPNPELLHSLYLAAPQDMLDIVKTQGKTQTVMVLGHNPGSAAMAQMLAGQVPDDPDFRRYPTGFTAVMTFSVDDWKDVDWGTGEVQDCIAPRRLADD